MKAHEIPIGWKRESREGYAMLVALVLLAVLTIIGATSLSVAGVDQRIAIHNQRHMIVVNTANAGTEHARWQLEHEAPEDEGWDTGDTGDHFVGVQGSDGAETMFEGSDFPMNQGVYKVDATYHKCGSPPEGYSAEIGSSSFRSDFWELRSSAMFIDDATGEQVNPIEATVVATVRKVAQGACEIR